VVVREFDAALVELDEYSMDSIRIAQQAFA
jgi:hypothetical protein